VGCNANGEWKEGRLGGRSGRLTAPLGAALSAALSRGRLAYSVCGKASFVPVAW